MVSQNPNRLRSKIPLLIAAVVGLVLIFVVRACVTDGPSGPAPPSRADRGECIPLNVTASSEKAALLSLIADDYNRANRQVNGRCVDVRVASLASGAAAEALTQDWDEAASGPRPDVWSPAARTWPVILRQRLAAADRPNLVPDAQPSIAQTPLVIAMPKPMAEALGWPNTPIGWSDLVALTRDPAGWGGRGHPEWGAFKLGKTNPNLSTSGLSATIAAYFAATGRSSDLTSADIANPKVVEFVRGVESGIVHYGDTTLTFLANLAEAGQRGRGLTYISAVTVEEKSVWDYNQGNPSGNPKTVGQQPAPKIPLVAIYPKDGTLVSDNPYIVLDAPWVDGVKQAAAADFLAYVRTPEQQERFAKAAFRSFEGKPGALITPDNGLLPDAKLAVLDPPGPQVLDQVAKSWTQLRKRANLVFVIDVSGSMSESVPSAGRSRLDLAKEAATAALPLLAPEDTLSLWTFSTPVQGQDKPYRAVVPPGKVSAIGEQYRRVVTGLVAEGGTALYATTRAAVQQMRAGFDPARINAVVLLTDGKNEYPADNNVDALVGDLRSEDAASVVRVFPIAYGQSADLNVLTDIAKATTAAAYDASDAASIKKVLINVISNF
ncbi:MAG: extracellular solute-binding protein [Pseudonocardiaceae bacterium]